MVDYGYAHQRARVTLPFELGQPCTRCRQPIADRSTADLGHVDADPTQYSGWEHQRCNRATATHRAALRRRAKEIHPGLLTTGPQGDDPKPGS